MKSKTVLPPYADLLVRIKQRIRVGQARAFLSANAEMIAMYWEIGGMLDATQKIKGWGKQIIPQLAMDLHNELPEVKGFSERNLGRMIAFFRAYPRLQEILPQAVAKSEVASKVPQPEGIFHISTGVVIASPRRGRGDLTETSESAHSTLNFHVQLMRSSFYEIPS